MNFLDILFPNRCLECNQIIPGKDVVCEICYQKIRFSHFEYDCDNILKQKCSLLFPAEHALPLIIFEKEGLSRKIIHQLKYGQREIIGEIIADWAIEKLNFGNDKPDLLVTIPIHQRKLKKRGYNQLHRFAEKLSGHYEIPCDHEILKRNLHTKAQALKSREQRLRSNRKFSLTKEIPGKHILLIDDVFTTGDTLSDAAWELLKNEGTKISILVMAMDE